MKFIKIRGAREHNLKNINLDIPKEKLVVITGISGSGKSSLAFNTIYAESQRLYIESLSTYARQFLGQMQKPDVDFMEGLSPSIAIEQRNISHNPRSTVGTVTEIYDYLRLLFARVGKAYCYNCGREITAQTPQQMADRILSLPEGSRILILAPVVRGKKGEYKDLFKKLRQEGYSRVIVDGETRELDEPIKLDKNKKHDIDVVVDRLVVDKDVRSRLTDSIEQALNLADGVLKIKNYDTGDEELFSSKFACVYCGISYPDIEPRLFSFNSPYGACPVCQGLGVTYRFEEEDIFPYPDYPLPEAKAQWVKFKKNFWRKLLDLFDYYGYDFYTTPYNELDEKFKGIFLYGTDEPIPITRGAVKYRGFWKFQGVVNYLLEYYKNAEDEERDKMEEYLKYTVCPACGGARLRKEALHVKIAGKNIYEVTQMTIKQALNFFRNLHFEGKEKEIADKIIKEIINRLSFMVDVGLDYLTLDRTMGTLSGGEAQRIRLATQIGSRLTGVLYILDEPSIGLHPRDVDRLIKSLKDLRDLGNTVIAVEHDESTIRSADFVIDLGPGAGENGGYVVATGTPEEIEQSENSLTGKYLSGKLKIPLPEKRRRENKGWIKIRGARTHNLKNVDVEIPMGMFVGITGVSGSGKSSLIVDMLYPSLKKMVHKRKKDFSSPEVDKIIIEGFIEKVINVDQSPIGRTPRSNPATYIGVFDDIRELFAMLPDARARGYKKGRFSFNVPGGRCEACKGEGLIRIEMHFLPDMYVVCDECKGKRYNRETLEIKFKGKDIADVLDMTVSEALDFFKNFPKIKRKLQLLADVGLDYIKLGQPSTTLSGGEAQRIKLGKELSRRNTGRNVYILDEPTTGLHFDDVRKLIAVLQRLVDAGNTVIVIEHNLDVLKSTDYIIDLGPEGGEEGGYVVATGTPEEIARNEKCYTGMFLRKVLTEELSHEN